MKMRNLWILPVCFVLMGFRFGSVELGEEAGKEVRDKTTFDTPQTQPPVAPVPPIDDTVLPKGNRILGIDVSEAEDGDFFAALDLAQETGLESISLSIYWNYFETSPGIYNPPVNFLALANQAYPPRNIKVELAIAVLDTSTSTVPHDLQGLPLNDPLVLIRFFNFINYVFSQIPDIEISAFSIGNEIDGMLGTDPVLWPQYEEFFKTYADYVRQVRPGTIVGTKGTYSGLTEEAKDFLLSMNQHSDAVFATYYPLNGDFSFRDPSVVPGEVESLLDIYPDKDVYFLEAGYSSGALIGSTEFKQAEFVRQMFHVWDKHPAKIRMVDFTWLHDRPIESFEAEKAILNDPRFCEFLTTLGLRRREGSGQDKEAFKVLKTEAKARGW